MSKKSPKTAIIIGAGPAGLTAAYELLEKTDIKPIIIEASPKQVGGIATTINYKGNRIDIGGHRFFSKSDLVLDWWAKVLPIEKAADGADITYHNKTRRIKTATVSSSSTEKVMLVRNRVSRIFFLGKFFDYPLSLTPTTLRKLGLKRTAKIGASYTRARLFPIKNETSLEDFFINRFGRELYLTFFKDYTEKVWGVPCDQISSEWGAQRVKGLSISKALTHALRAVIVKDKSVGQKKTQTSLIERFLYPKFGPGQMWEEVAEKVKVRDGKILMGKEVVSISANKGQVTSIVTKDYKTGKEETLTGDYFFSSMPIKTLVSSLSTEAPADIKRIANGLIYRDFVTVGLLLKRLKSVNQSSTAIIPDTWIYIQERQVKVGRLQIFNNWSPFMVKDPSTVWVGMEYCCYEGDEFWNKKDPDMKKFAIEELSQIGLIDQEDVIDSVVIRFPKTYPAYFGTYNEFPKLRRYLDQFENLYLVGRNGMHKYNNQDHSMLTAITAVTNISSGVKSKDNIWAINTEEDYHEEK